MVINKDNRCQCANTNKWKIQMPIDKRIAGNWMNRNSQISRTIIKLMHEKYFSSLPTVISICFLSIRPPVLLQYNVYLFGVLYFFGLFLKSLVYGLRKSAIGISYRNKKYSHYLFALHFFTFSSFCSCTFIFRCFATAVSLNAPQNVRRWRKMCKRGFD